MAILINIDTSTPVGSVCLSRHGIALRTLYHENQRDHAARLPNIIEELMNEFLVTPDQIGAIAIAGGPGSYTGLRVATATAKGLCFAWGIPLIAINTLEVMASGMIRILQERPGLYCPMMDARREEVYTALYLPNLTAVMDPVNLILGPDSFNNWKNEPTLFFFGDGSEKWKKNGSLFKGAEFPDYFPSASHLAPLAEKAFLQGHFQDLAYFEPFYLKPFFQHPPV
ncbi:MAG: tRNA (adenosine(37)-N6)-threonylcarbamoyltransferase complex dimerization subunit type 1 TsaB [Chitinophagaceae bacterium]